LPWLVSSPSQSARLGELIPPVSDGGSPGREVKDMVNVGLSLHHGQLARHIRRRDNKLPVTAPIIVLLDDSEQNLLFVKIVKVSDTVIIDGSEGGALNSITGVIDLLRLS
jgi:hypothetical protein